MTCACWQQCDNEGVHYTKSSPRTHGMIDRVPSRSWFLPGAVVLSTSANCEKGCSPHTNPGASFQAALLAACRSQAHRMEHQVTMLTIETRMFASPSSSSDVSRLEKRIEDMERTQPTMLPGNLRWKPPSLSPRTQPCVALWCGEACQPRLSHLVDVDGGH